MGYIPPPPGSFAMLQPGVELIEVTCLEDAQPRYVQRYPSGKSVRGWYEAEAAYAEHRTKMATMHAETMLQARIGSFLLLALVADLIAMVAGMLR